MKSGIGQAAPRVYAVIYLALTGLLLLSFLPLPRLDVSSLPTSFRWRKDLISLFSRMRLSAGDRVFNKTLVGQDGWLFYSGEQSISDYQHAETVKRKTLVQLQKELDSLNADLRQQGKTLLVVIVPNKSTVYPQYMPGEITSIGEASRLDQFITFMQARGSTKVIDLRPMLIAQTASDDVYFRTDTHWNELGAYLGAREILNTLSGEYPVLAPFPLSGYVRKDLGMQTSDLPRLMGIPQLQEDHWALVLQRRESQNESGAPATKSGTNPSTADQPRLRPRLLIYHDSFYVSLRKFIAPRFSHVKAIRYTSNPKIWSTGWIDRESPDVVIIELAERYLYGLFPLLENSH